MRSQSQHVPLRAVHGQKDEGMHLARGKKLPCLHLFSGHPSLRQTQTESPRPYPYVTACLWVYRLGCNPCCAWAELPAGWWHASISLTFLKEPLIHSFRQSSICCVTTGDWATGLLCAVFSLLSTWGPGSSSREAGLCDSLPWLGSSSFFHQLQSKTTLCSITKA